MSIDETNTWIKPLFLFQKNTVTMAQPDCQLLSPTQPENNDNKTAHKVQLIDAQDDTQAIIAFLEEYAHSPQTFRSYAKEIERLLLWCLHKGEVTISSLRREHLLAYQTFLKSPTPKQRWCGPNVRRQKKEGTLNPDWRPFVKGLSPSSMNTVLTIIDSFLNYLVQTNYLNGNPLTIDRKRKKRKRAKPRYIDRYLERHEIEAVLEALSDDSIHNNYIDRQFQVTRAHYIILLLFYTGLRISEAAEHGMKHFIQREQRWFLRVTGKGKKDREIPIPMALMDALGNFRLSVGLSSREPTFREKVPLISMRNLKQPISPRRINQILKWAFDLGANKLEPQKPRSASKLRQASAHWLRHSYVTYLLDSGAPLKVAQENAGHSDVGTTMHYRHITQVDRYLATNALSLKPTMTRDKET